MQSTAADRIRRAYKIDEATLILARTPRTLDALLRGLPDGWTTAHEGGQTWSPFDVLGHLIHADRTNFLVRARMILEHGETCAFEDFDRFAQFASSKGRTIESLLDEFAAVRAETLIELQDLALTESSLDRKGLHPALGVVTLRQLLATWVAHDLDHIYQVIRAMANQYGDEVGPWREYLRIIRDAPK